MDAASADMAQLTRAFLQGEIFDPLLEFAAEAAARDTCATERALGAAAAPSFPLAAIEAHRWTHPSAPRLEEVAMDRPSVRRYYIVIVNWNGWQDTFDCLHSLRRSRTQTTRSSSSTTAPLTTPLRHCARVSYRSARRNRREPWVRWREQRRHSSSHGGGRRLRVAVQQRHVVDPLALTTLVDAAQSNPRIGVVGSKITLLVQTRSIWYAGGELSWRGWTRHRGEGERDGGQYDVRAQTTYVTGCSLLARTDMIRDVGLMAEDYFLYWEEVDWNTRAAKAGWELVYEPSSFLWHKVAASQEVGRGKGYTRARYDARNRIVFYKRNLPEQLPRVLLSAYLRAATTLFPHFSFRTSRAIVQGIADGLAGKTGKIE